MAMLGKRDGVSREGAAERFLGVACKSAAADHASFLPQLERHIPSAARLQRSGESRGDAGNPGQGNVKQ
jgi:hypothetical protein